MCTEAFMFNEMIFFRISNKKGTFESKNKKGTKSSPFSNMTLDQSHDPKYNKIKTSIFKSYLIFLL
jgi:hypothetical protein